MSMPLRITPRPVKKLRAAPTPKCESIAIVNAIQAAVRPLNRRNGATGMNAPTAVDTPVSHPSLRRRVGLPDLQLFPHLLVERPLRIKIGRASCRERV